MRRLGDFHEQNAQSGVAAGPPWRALGSLALLWDVLKREHPQRRPVRAGGAPEARLPSNHLSFLLPLPIPPPAVVGAKPSAGSAPPELFQLPLVPGALSERSSSPWVYCLRALTLPPGYHSLEITLAWLLLGSEPRERCLVPHVVLC